MRAKHPIEGWLADHGTSQRALAEQAGLDHSTLCRYLGGRRALSVDAARALREVTGLSLDAILSPVKRGSISRAMGTGMTERRGKAGRR